MAGKKKGCKSNQAQKDHNKKLLELYMSKKKCKK